VDEGRSSISADVQYQRIGVAAPIIIDERRGPAFDADERMIAGAIRRNPDEIQNRRRKLPSGPAAVVYSVHGHEASQEAAVALRSGGVNASYLEHGIAGWAGTGCRSAA
jgi:thiosulfate sulfurtransferase